MGLASMMGMKPRADLTPQQMAKAQGLATFLMGAGGLLKGDDIDPIMQNFMAQRQAELQKSQQDEANKLVSQYFGGMAPSVSASGRMRTPGASTPRTEADQIGDAAMSAIGKPNADRDLLAKTLMAEAGGEGLEGMLAAGAVINNRVRAGGYGDGLQGVIMKPGQFSAWNSKTGYAGGQGGLDMDNIRPSQAAYQAADMILSGQYEDPTGGATHYYNPAAADPKWGMRNGGNWQRIGNHVFGSADAGRGVQRANSERQIDPQRALAIINHPGASPAVKQLFTNLLAQQMKPRDPSDPRDRYMNVDGVLYDVTGASPRPVTERTAKPNAAVQQIGRLEALGIPNDVATKITDGVYKVDRDPITREIQVVDISNGQLVWGGAQTEPTPTTEPTTAAPQLTFGGDASDAFGVEGWSKGVANTVADVAGFDAPFKGVQDTQSDFGVLREQMLNDMASAYDRQPPSWLLEEIRELTPAAGSLREGAGGAQSKMRALKRHFESELAIAERGLSRRMSPDQRQNAEVKVSGLRAAIGRVDAALGRFSTGQQQKTSSGVSWSIEE